MTEFQNTTIPPLITTKEITKIPILARLTLVLFGIFITSLIFAITIKQFQETGIWIGLALCIAIIFCGFYYIEKGTRLRLITWSILATILLGTAAYFILLHFLSSNLGNVLK